MTSRIGRVDQTSQDIVLLRRHKVGRPTEPFPDGRDIGSPIRANPLVHVGARIVLP